MKALREYSPQARHHFTRFDQVDLLVRASEAAPDTGFMARLMMLCSLPRTNPGRQLQYKRVNGPYTLIMTAVGQTGLPFRQSLPPFVGLGLHGRQSAPKAARWFWDRRSPGSCAGWAWLQSGVAAGAAARGLRNQMKRLFNAHIQLAYEDKQVSASVNSPVASRTGFWWTKRKTGERLGWESQIELGEKFFSEIIRHPVPLDLNILKALKRSALGLDLYLCLTYRTFALKRPLRLSWGCLYRQFGVNPGKADDHYTVKNFRKDGLRELGKIKVAWPDLNYSTAQGVLIVWPSKPAIVPEHLPLVE